MTVVTPEELTERINAAPLHRWLGLEVLAVSADELRLRATWRPEWSNGTEAQVTHGGILATLLDLAADWCLFAAQAAVAPTLDFTTHFLRAAVPGDLEIVARPTKLGRAVSVAEAEVIDARGKTVATGRGSYAVFAASTPGE